MSDSEETGEGRKDDQQKPKWGILPVESLTEVVLAAQHGVAKYGEDNWQLVPNARERYIDATYRHMAAWRKGEVKDPESGRHHLAHAICSLIFVLWFDLKKNQTMGFWEARCHEQEAITRGLRRQIIKKDMALRSASMAIPPGPFQNPAEEPDDEQTQYYENLYRADELR